MIDKTLRFAAAALALGTAACSIDVNDGGDWDRAHYTRGDLDYGERRIVVEKPVDSRSEASAALAAILDEGRAKGCKIVSADSWRTLDHRDGPDVKGPRVVMTCRDGTAL